MRESRFLEFRTLAILYMVAGGVIAFFVHFFVLSTPWAAGIYGMVK